MVYNKTVTVNILTQASISADNCHSLNTLSNNPLNSEQPFNFRGGVGRISFLCLITQLVGQSGDLLSIPLKDAHIYMVMTLTSHNE